MGTRKIVFIFGIVTAVILLALLIFFLLLKTPSSSEVQDGFVQNSLKQNGTILPPTFQPPPRPELDTKPCKGRRDVTQDPAIVPYDTVSSSVELFLADTAYVYGVNVLENKKYPLYAILPCERVARIDQHGNVKFYLSGEEGVATINIAKTDWYPVFSEDGPFESVNDIEEVVDTNGDMYFIKQVFTDGGNVENPTSTLSVKRNGEVEENVLWEFKNGLYEGHEIYRVTPESVILKSFGGDGGCFWGSLKYFPKKDFTNFRILWLGNCFVSDVSYRNILGDTEEFALIDSVKKIPQEEGEYTYSIQKYSYKDFTTEPVANFKVYTVNGENNFLGSISRLWLESGRLVLVYSSLKNAKPILEVQEIDSSGFVDKIGELPFNADTVFTNQLFASDKHIFVTLQNNNGHILYAVDRKTGSYIEVYKGQSQIIANVARVSQP